MSEDFLKGLELPSFRWWSLADWRHRVAIRGFDDGICHQWNGYGDCYHPPLLFFRKTYIDEFNEGVCK